MQQKILNGEEQADLLIRQAIRLLEDRSSQYGDVVTLSAKHKRDLRRVNDKLNTLERAMIVLEPANG